MTHVLGRRRFHNGAAFVEDADHIREGLLYARKRAFQLYRCESRAVVCARPACFAAAVRSVTWQQCNRATPENMQRIVFFGNKSCNRSNELFKKQQTMTGQ